jgi:hypothetical protein
MCGFGTKRAGTIAVSFVACMVVAAILCSVEFAAVGRKRTHKRKRARLTGRVRPLSVVTKRRVRIWRKPGRGSLGEVYRRTYLPFVKKIRATTRTCPSGRWYLVGPRRYLCADYASPSHQFPHGVTRPVLRKGKLIPIPVYFARRDGVPVYKSREDAAAGRLDRVVERGFAFAVRYVTRIGKKRYVKTRAAEFVPRKEMYRHRPSDFAGKQLDGRPERPLACVVARKGAVVYRTAGRRRVDRLKRLTWVSIWANKKVRRRRYLQIGKNRWIRARAVRRIHFSKPPRYVKKPHEVWIEVLTRHQTLVVYKGKKPVFATLVATGKYSDPTPHGLFRVWIKIAVEAMNNRPGAADQYKVEAVPWILYFHKGYAIHGAYWHNGFGRRRSHGCVNLSPRDARVVFGLAQPPLPPGWHSRWSDTRTPGTLIRVRRNTRQKVGWFKKTK